MQRIDTVACTGPFAVGIASTNAEIAPAGPDVACGYATSRHLTPFVSISPLTTHAPGSTLLNSVIFSVAWPRGVCAGGVFGRAGDVTTAGGGIAAAAGTATGCCIVGGGTVSASSGGSGCWCCWRVALVECLCTAGGGCS